MSSNDEKKSYCDMAAKTFYIQEEGTEADYKKEFNKLACNACSILPKKKLYRYRSNLKWKRVEPIIKNNEVYLCPLDKQNDPFEFAFLDDFGEVVKQVPELRQGSDITCMNYALMIEDVWNKMREELYSYKSKMSIACFCEDKDNLLLWAHYANNNKGFCIEYSLLDLLEYFQCFLLPVVYRDTLPVLPGPGKLSPYRLALERISTKSDVWSYEKEWRIIKCIEPSEKHCVEFPKPTAIYLGSNATKRLENKLLELCVEKKISLYKMTVDRYSYKLNDELVYDALKGASKWTK